MEQVVNYKGFDIRVMSGQTKAGKCWGKYQIAAASAGAERVFARESLGEFGSERIHQTSDDRATSPRVLNTGHVLSIAMQEINLALKKLT